MSTLRKYYLFATACFTIGAILAVSTASYTALFVFLVLAAFTFWVSTRVDALQEERHPHDLPGHRDDH